MSVEKEFEEIPEFVKKFVPGIMRGLSWAKYKQEKDEGTVLKSEAFQDSRKEGFQAAKSAPVGPEGDQIFEKISKEMWFKVNNLTQEAKKISETINNQKTKEEREQVLSSAKEAAREAGLHAAVAAGWEKGWNEGMSERDLK
ncbi:MAG: hypothetical protein CMB30_02945 [Euryarchaeota archaeon]|nr:hypothetical protein [Euryarchaeota archaeon]